jgi:hypothetical protein
MIYLTYFPRFSHGTASRSPVGQTEEKSSMNFNVKIALIINKKLNGVLPWVFSWYLVELCMLNIPYKNLQICPVS